MPNLQPHFLAKNDNDETDTPLIKDFCNDLSHKMRTPLTLIRGFTELLLTSGDLNDSQIESLQIILSNECKLERLAQEIEDLLIFTLRKIGTY